ncbi:hypothetical protein AYI68_g2252, partial [Smittium mucronatum]
MYIFLVYLERNVKVSRVKREEPKVDPELVQNDELVPIQKAAESSYENPFSILDGLQSHPDLADPSPNSKKTSSAPPISPKKNAKKKSVTLDTKQTSSKCPVLRAESNFRIPWATRQKTLEKVYSELVKLYSQCPQVSLEAISAEAIRKE